jgi:N-succinyldiaminopimelate aminotransferase
VIARRLRPFGTTIFTEMSALAARSGALNLGQGSPDTDGPAEVVEAAATALRSGRANQYAPLGGVPELRAAIAAHQLRRYAVELDPDDGIQVTFGATEAIAATMLGLVEPGDAVLVLEPFYDSYGAMIAMAGGERRLVTLRPPDFAVDLDALAAAARRAPSSRGSPRSASSTISSPSPTRSTSTSSSTASTCRSRRCQGWPSAR